MQQPTKIIISGGGTGGHIFPAIAIANALKEKIKDVDILFVGAIGRMEMEKVPAAGYKIIGLNISGFQRRFTLKNLSFPFKLLQSIIKANKIINSFKPDAVIGVGGYASGPILKVACKKNIPTLIQEQNSYAGITNKLLAKKVTKICVAYEGMEKFFPKDKIILTGNPVRKEVIITEGKKEIAAEYFNLNPSKKTVLVVGGSLGARTINEAIASCVKSFADNDIQLIWQTGKNYAPIAKEISGPYQHKGIRVYDFITKMDYAYSIADIVISRAGAIAISELCCIGKPSILIPSPFVAEDHQTKNAMALVNKSAAILVKDSETSKILFNNIISLINDNETQETLKQNISNLAFRNSAELISEEVIKILKTK